MNIRKIAVFVEGQTEYIFVRDFLCAWYEFDAKKIRTGMLSVQWK